MFCLVILGIGVDDEVCIRFQFSFCFGVSKPFAIPTTISSSMAKKKPKEVNVTILPKQLEALEILKRDSIRQLVFGGAKGGGKTDLGCIWVLTNCVQYPGTRWIIGRAEFTKLRKSTLDSFFKICRDWGLLPDKHYSYNQQTNIIRFSWGSEIYLLDLAEQVSDIEYSRWGGIQVSGVFVDEASEITEKARNILLTLIRYGLEGKDQFGNPYKITPKILMTCNPIKNHFLYSEFYKPSQEGTLHPSKYYLPSLPTDNPTLPEEYLDVLRSFQFSDPTSYKRLYLGLWEYDSSNSLVEQDALHKLMNQAPGYWEYTGQTMSLTADIARLGKDSTTIVLWDKLSVIDIITLSKQTTDVTSEKIKDLILKYRIQPKNIIIDADGIGGGVIDQLPRGVVSFINNSKPLHGEQYQNLKTQCYFRLANEINKGSIRFKYKFQNPDLRSRIELELQQIIQDKVDSDGKLSILRKEEVKRLLGGNSPDYSDALMLRMYNEVLNSTRNKPGEYRIYSRFISASS